MNTSLKKYYLGTIFLLTALFVGTVFIQRGLAWTNPTSNPPYSINAMNVANGNIGIGTGSPAYKLDINGGIGSAIRIAGGGDLQIDPQNSGGPSVLYNDTGTLNVTTGINANGAVNGSSLCIGGNCQSSWPSSGIGGSGIASYLSKWTSGSVLGNSQIMDDGTTVTIPNTLSVGGTGSNFGTTGAYIGTQTPTLGVSENNRLPWLQFHTGGYQEAFIRLARNTRVFEMGDSQNVGVDLALLNGAGTQNVYLSPRGTSYFNGGNVGIGTGSPSYKLDVSGTARVSSDLAVGGELSFGVSGTRTQTKQDAGAQGGKSGFYEASAPVNYPTGASSWWHLLDVRHSNTSNNYAMQFAGSFFDQNLWFRKTNNSGSTAWQRVLTTADAVGGVDGSGTANYIPKFTAGTTLGNSSIYDNGNVGVGTNSPIFKLDINGNAIFGTTAATYIYLRDDESTTGPKSIHANSNVVGFLNGAGTWMSYWDNGGNQQNAGAISLGGNLNFSAANPYISASSYFIAPGGAYFNGGAVYTEAPIQARGGVHNDTNTYLTISGGTGGITYFNGNVGIGTATPGAKLEVAGQIKITGGTPGAGKVLTSDASGLASWITPSSGMGGSGTANYIPKFTAGSTLGDSSIFDNGNVGIGATNPQAKLSVGSNGLVNYGIYSKGSASGVYGEGSTGYGVFGYATTGTGVNGMSTSYRGVTGDSNSGIGGYFTSGSGYALITGNGNVGIGTSNPASKLSVGGDGNSLYGVYSNHTNVGMYGNGGGTGLWGVGGNTGVYGNGGGTGVAGQGGTVGVSGVGTTYDFYANGAGVNYGAPSSIRWKKNMQPMSDILGKINNISTVYFDWDAAHGGQRDLGFIGEEVGAYFPEVVAWDKDAPGYVTGMDYSKMTPILLGAIKEQQKQIEQKQSLIDSLTKRIERLESLVK